MKTMKIVALLNIFLFTFLRASSQFCYDTLQQKNKDKDIVPSAKFNFYATSFLKFAKEKQLTEIDTSCKGSDRAKAMIEKLDKGFECSYFSNNKKGFSIDSYCKQKDENVNFGLLEIVYNSSKESQKAYRIFSEKKYFRHYDKILRIYYPILCGNRLIIFHTATPENKQLEQFFFSIGIKHFILET